MEYIKRRLNIDLNYEIHYWRTKTGMEVDFVLGKGEVAVEVKGTSRVDRSDLVGLNSFVDSYSPRMAICVWNEKEPRLHGRIKIMPWRHFLGALWEGKVIG
jgi:predicted AAA+ superfamily ATPase